MKLFDNDGPFDANAIEISLRHKQRFHVPSTLRLAMAYATSTVDFIQFSFGIRSNGSVALLTHAEWNVRLYANHSILDRGKNLRDARHKLTPVECDHWATYVENSGGCANDIHAIESGQLAQKNEGIDNKCFPLLSRQTEIVDHPETA